MLHQALGVTLYPAGHGLAHILNLILCAVSGLRVQLGQLQLQRYSDCYRQLDGQLVRLAGELEKLRFTN